MPTGTWIITRAPGGNGSSALLNCRIEGTSTVYSFFSPQPNNQLLAGTSDTAPPIPFRFNYAGLNWTVTIDNLTPRPSGSWSNDGVDPESGSGTWSTDTGTDEDDDADVDEDEEGEEGEEEEDAEGEHSAD